MRHNPFSLYYNMIIVHQQPDCASLGYKYKYNIMHIVAKSNSIALATKGTNMTYIANDIFRMIPFHSFQFQMTRFIFSS